MRNFLLLLILPFGAFSQNLRSVSAQAAKAVESRKPLPVVNTAANKLFINFIRSGSKAYMELSGSGWGTATVNNGDEAILLFANDSTVTLRSTDVQGFEYGAARPTYKHRYAIAIPDVTTLSRYKLVGIRKYNFHDWSDVAIPAERAEPLKNFSAGFWDELTQAGLVPTFWSIGPGKVAAHAGDSVSFCAVVLSAGYDAAGGPMLLELQPEGAASTVQAVIPVEYRNRFPDFGETLYTGKKLCVAGIVRLRNGMPQLVLRSRPALKITGSITDKEAALFVGDSVTVTGTVASVVYLANSDTKPTLLNMGEVYPEQTLTVVIAEADRSQFGGKPEEVYLGKKISVRGTVTLYKGKPQIAVRSQEQLWVVANAETTVKKTPAKTLPVTATAPVTARPAPAKSNVAAPPPVTTVPMNTAVDSPVAGLLSKSMIVEVQPAVRREKVNRANLYVETLASYPGGEAALQSFLTERLHCPGEDVPEPKTVTASFQVEMDGSVSSFRIEESGGKTYDAELIRVLKGMPKWTPRVRNGFTTLDKLYQTVTFKCKAGISKPRG